jgi:hypothetical protein
MSDAPNESVLGGSGDEESEDPPINANSSSSGGNKRKQKAKLEIRPTFRKDAAKANGIVC